jgi:hypothetical protein
MPNKKCTGVAVLAELPSQSHPPQSGDLKRSPQKMSSNPKSDIAPFRIVILEDDPIQAEWLADKLWKNAPNAEIMYFDSEHSISKVIDTNVADLRPHLFILDLLVRPFSPSDLEESSSADFSDFPGVHDAHAAGVRIAKQIRANDVFADSPIIFLSVMDDPRAASSESLSKTLFIRKGREGELDRLILAVRSVAAALHEPLSRPKKSRLLHAADAADLKPSFMGMSIDLKKLWEALAGG